jgi:hypothetical protein
MCPHNSAEPRYFLQYIRLAFSFLSNRHGIYLHAVRRNSLLGQLSQSPVLQGFSRINRKFRSAKNPLRIVYYNGVN